MKRIFGIAAALALLTANAAANQKGINYDPLIFDTCSYGCAIDGRLVAADMALIQQLGLTFVRFSTTAYPLIQTPTNTSDNNALATTNLNTVLSAVVAAGLTPLLEIQAWCYAPTPTSPPCANQVTGTNEPVNTRAAYEAWLANLVKTTGITYFEIGNEPNLNAYEESGSRGKLLNPDIYQSGWAIPDCQLDNATNTVAQCNLLTGKNDGANPSGACPNGSPSPAYTNAVLSYIAFLQDSFTTIKAANPNAKVLVGGISSFRGQCFFDLLLQNNAFSFADIISFHAYPTTSGAQSGAATVAYLKGKTSLPIWITEFGFSTGARNDNSGSEGVKASLIGQEWSLLEAQLPGPIMLWAARDGITNFNWDNPDVTTPLTGFGFGLYEWAKPCKAAACTVSKLPSFSVYQALK